MLVDVKGDNQTAATVRAVLRHEDYVLEGYFPKYRFVIDEAPVLVDAEAAIVLDSVDGRFERVYLKHLRQLFGRVTIQEAGGNRREDTMHIIVPAHDDVARRAVSLAALRALDDQTGRGRRRWWRPFAIVALICAWPCLAAAQTSQVTIVEADKTATVRDTGGTNDALNVAIVDGNGNQITSFGSGGGLTNTELRATAVPVSLASMPTTPVTGTFFQATQPVSGTFFQATQPVSLASMPSTPVTGTFWQATQPVSGSFFQATQPVSLATAPTTPVTGTFWQATQPVSGTFFQATQPVSIASMPSTPVTGTFFQATQPVSIATMPSTPVTNANLDAGLSTLLKPADTLTAVKIGRAHV